MNKIMCILSGMLLSLAGLGQQKNIVVTEGAINPPDQTAEGISKNILRKGEARDMHFTITNENLKFYDTNMKYTSKPSDFKVFTGPNSRDTQNRILN